MSLIQITALNSHAPLLQVQDVLRSSKSGCLTKTGCRVWVFAIPGFQACLGFEGALQELEEVSMRHGASRLRCSGLGRYGQILSA